MVEGTAHIAQDGVSRTAEAPNGVYRVEGCLSVARGLVEDATVGFREAGVVAVGCEGEVGGAKVRGAADEARVWGVAGGKEGGGDGEAERGENRGDAWV